MSPPLEQIVEGFEINAAGVRDLIDFDRQLLEFSADQMEQLSRSVPQAGLAQKIQRTADILRGIRNNDSLKPRFQIIYNQAVVLLVSYFGSTVEDIFKLGVSQMLNGGATAAALRETELRLTFGDLEERGWELKESAAELLVEKKDLSFQDMQAIARAFREYLEIEVARGPWVDNVILAQACRHVIVHAGATATTRMIRQLRKADLRQLKPKIVVGQKIDFSPDEIVIVETSMLRYIHQLSASLKDKFTAF